MSIRGLPTFLVLAFLVSSPARAEGAALSIARDAPPPDQAVRTDPERPAYRLALVADPLGAIRGEYGVGLRRAFGRFQALDLTPAFVAVEGRRGLSLELGYLVFPLGRGLVGPYVETFVGGVFARSGDEPQGAFRVGGELGYLHVLSGGLVGGGFGAAVDREAARDGDLAVVLRARVFLGYAFL